MRDQHLYQSPAVEVFGRRRDYYYPDWGSLIDFFAIQGKKIAGMARESNW